MSEKGADERKNHAGPVTWGVLSKDVDELSAGGVKSNKEKATESAYSFGRKRRVRSDCAD